MPIATLLPLLVDILAQAPAVVDSVQSIWKLATADNAPTDAEHASYNAALEAAHAALQAS